MFKNLPRELLIALRVTLVIAAVGGLIYPLVMTGFAQVAFPGQANGSLIKNSSGTVVGSSLIGQCFYQPNQKLTDYLQTEYQGETFYVVDPRYFQGRPSYYQTTGSNGQLEVVPLDPPCQASNSQGSNLSPSNPLLIKRVDTYAEYLHCLGVDSTVSYTGSQLAQVAADPSKYCTGAVSNATSIPVDLVTGDFTSFDPDISEAAALAQVNMVAGARGIDPTKLTQLVEANVTGRSLGILGQSYVNVLQLDLAVNQEFRQPPALP
ncbi:MAG: potassium-transporting ATPase subunit C [Candidatus Dormiibacterota bacterium]